MGQKNTVNVIGAGLSGLFAAITLAENDTPCRLFSSQPSERAQSVLAEGGINAALDTMGENDSVTEHFNDTMKGGCFLESEEAVKALTDNAPEIVRKLVRLGVPFNSVNGSLILRNFGGQKKKRTAFAKSSTGKIIMTVLIDEVRKYEAKGLVERFPHHELINIVNEKGSLEKITVRDGFTGEIFSCSGTTILCTGGLNGFFEGFTTGTSQNTGNAAAIAFRAGAEMSDLEFLQYHPTTIGICGKRMLISEAARGEGGRLYIEREGKPWYFMEEKYPELKNLMPRDVVSREMFFAKREYGGEVYLDMTGIDEYVWKHRLSDLRDEILSYIHYDPKTVPIPVSPGIHFFMGGIRTDITHKTSIDGLYAAGEAASKYHGANRLGGNSMLGALFGGRTAALNAVKNAYDSRFIKEKTAAVSFSSPEIRAKTRDILLSGLGIVRNKTELGEALHSLNELSRENNITDIDKIRLELSKAMLISAIERKESRGAHCRSDHPKTRPEYQRHSITALKNGKITHYFDDINEVRRRENDIFN